jgi:hypothetical protein
MLGALKILTQQETWQGDDQDAINQAIQRANLLLVQWSEGCLMGETFRQQDDCLLQRSVDGGLSWDTLFDASACVLAMARSGRIPGLGPFAPVTTQENGNCTVLGITLYANSVFQWPYLINAGDIITVSVFEDHGWSGTLNVLSDTHCADGGFLDSFLQCGGSADPGHTGDPLPSASHMRLVANVDGTWADAYNQAITVGGGVSNGTFGLQANDDILIDNTGWIGVHVEVCKPGWNHAFDFTIDEQGWVPVKGGDAIDRAAYSSGVGWVPNGAFPSETRIQRTVAETVFEHAVLNYTAPVTTTSIGFHFNSMTPNGSGTAIASWNGSDTTAIPRIDVDDNPSPPTLTKLLLSGPGADPF